MPHVELDSLRKTFPGGTVAVDGLSLELADGELVALIGPSGCGKTSTLRLIAGLERPCGGSIRLDGHDIAASPPHQRGVAMVFQHPVLYPHWTVRRNLSASLTLRREASVSPRETDERVAAVAAVLRIGDLLDRRPWQLSGGQRQRVALGRALVLRPRLMLLDEPLASLEPALRDELRRAMRQLLKQWGATTLLVTHDQQEAMALGDRVAIMHQGRIAQLGEPAEVYRHPVNRVVASLLGSPPMNLVDGELLTGTPPIFRGKDWALAVDSLAAERVQLYLSQRLTLGFRPEWAMLRAAAAESRRQPGNIGRVTAVEHCGHAAMLWLAPASAGDDWSCGSAPWAVQVGADHAARVDEEYEVIVDWKRAQWFAGPEGRNVLETSASNDPLRL